jgi:hypothetical protein
MASQQRLVYLGSRAPERVQSRVAIEELSDQVDQLKRGQARTALLASGNRDSMLSRLIASESLQFVCTARGKLEPKRQ